MRIASILVLATLVVAGCSNSTSKQYSFHSDKYDSYTQGTLSIESVPTHAMVYAKMRYKAMVDGHTPQGNVSQNLAPEQITNDMKDWTLIGTTPVTDFKVMLSGKSSDRHINSSATITIQLEQLELRVEKEGYRRVEIERVGFVDGKNKLVLDLVPNDATTRPGP